jgi:hypothetical protein
LTGNEGQPMAHLSPDEYRIIYVRDHSEAEFSHGVCPECLDVILGELGE